jgi:predicted permease
MAVLGGVVVLILLIVCANVANLLLSRAAARQKEILVRLSMGATRWRLIRQLLTESVVLALVGAAFGVLVAYWGQQLLPGVLGDAPMDWRVLGFAAGLAIVTGTLFGIAPAVRATAGDVGTALRETSRTITSRTLLGKSLLVAQIAISVVLVIGAGLFLRTVDNLQRVDVGFNAGNLVIFRLNPELNGYDADRIEALYQQMTQRLRAVPGVLDVTLSDLALLSGGVSTTDLYRPGDARDDSADRGIHRLRIAPNFFEVMGIPLLSGRALTDRDVDGAPRVAVLNEAAVRKFFRDGNPLGASFGSSPEDANELQIVGVVRDAKYESVREAAPPTMYVPYRQAQGPSRGMAFEVRTAGDASQATAAVRAAVRDVDATVPMRNVTTQLDAIATRFAQEQLFARASAAFGGLALLVAAIGLFGLMSYSVARRTSEIGIRMALGADRGAVVVMIMRESLVLVAAGVVIGLAAALGAGRLIASQLFGVTPFDATTFAVAVLVMSVVSAVAGYWPARRASHVDPIEALQYE